jgi:ATP-dependent DNA ligase
MTFPGCQLADAYETWPDCTEVGLEPKLDGYRLCIVIPEEGSPSVHCRDAKPPSWAANVRHIVDELAGNPLFRGCLIDGEVGAFNWGRTSQLLRKKGAQQDPAFWAQVVAEVKFTVFDMVRLQSTWAQRKLTERSRNLVNVSEASFAARRRVLEGVFHEARLEHSRPISHFRARNEAELHTLFDEFIELGFEGAIVKLLDAPYAFDRSPFWLKMKPFKTIDLKIVDFLEGKGQHVGRLGAFICENERSQRIRVGGGLTNEMRDSYWAQRASLVGSLIEVKCQDDDVATARHPVFVRFREDQNKISVAVNS